MAGNREGTAFGGENALTAGGTRGREEKIPTSRAEGAREMGHPRNTRVGTGSQNPHSNVAKGAPLEWGTL
jgi:hypothetical protein